MTNILQRDTTQQSLLDGVEPDGFINTGGNLWSLATMEQHLGNPDYRWAIDKHWTPSKKVFSEDKVEALLIANRKQVLLEAAERCTTLAITGNPTLDGSWSNASALDCADELRRMALEPTGVDKGEKE